MKRLTALICCLLLPLLLSACAMDAVMNDPEAAANVQTALDQLRDYYDMTSGETVPEAFAGDAPADAPDETPVDVVVPTVTIGGQAFDRSLSVITLPEGTTADELALLADFEDLEDVDATALQVSPELFAASDEHPTLHFNWSYFGKPFNELSDCLDLSNQTGVDAQVIEQILDRFPNIVTIDLTGTDLSADDLHMLALDYPNEDFVYTVEAFGQTLPADTTTLDLQNSEFASADEVKAALSLLPKLVTVDMRGCNLTDEELGSLQDAFPGTTFIWIIHVGAWEIRTDITAFSKGQRHSFPNGMGFYGKGKDNFYSEDCEPLKYCKNLEHLDLGHGNRITDLSFLTGLTKLRTLILSMNKIEDITPLAALENLEMLEIYQNYIVDLTPLLSLPKLTYLNISRNSFEGIETLKQMKQLKMLWLVNTRQVTSELRAELEAALPDCEFCYKASTSSQGGWLKNPLYREYQTAYGLKFYDD